MKSIIYFFITIVLALTLTSGVEKNSEKSTIITLQATGNNTGSVELKQSADIITARLKLYGLNSTEVKVLTDKGQLIVLLPDNINLSEVEELITSKGELSFYETYSKEELTKLLGSENKLFKILKNEQNYTNYNPRVGCGDIENRRKADELLASSLPVKNCKLFWGYESDKAGYCLFALKTSQDGNPLLGRSDVESVKIVTSVDRQNTKIQISLKTAAAGIFGDATRANLNKAIAIVIDDRVYSWPVVRSVIEGGEIEVTGSFTPEEAAYFPALFNSEKLPVEFRIVK
jgi:preprotein translocase subunit SecD